MLAPWRLGCPLTVEILCLSQRPWIGKARKRFYPPRCSGGGIEAAAAWRYRPVVGRLDEGLERRVVVVAVLCADAMAQ